MTGKGPQRLEPAFSETIIAAVGFGTLTIGQLEVRGLTEGHFYLGLVGIRTEMVFNFSDSAQQKESSSHSETPLAFWGAGDGARSL